VIHVQSGIGFILNFVELEPQAKVALARIIARVARAGRPGS